MKTFRIKIFDHVSPRRFVDYDIQAADLRDALDLLEQKLRREFGWKPCAWDVASVREI